MPDSSLASNLKKIYETWNIRSAVLFSLSLQIILIVIAPFRKRTGKRLVHLVIWLAYLLADAAAIFAVGLIFRTEKNAATDHHSAPAGLLAFWAPFLLLHLGGPDTITALALEDNELWLRHCFTLVTQGIPTGYVFFRTRLRNKVWLPTLLLFLAAIVKYLERTFSLFFASTDRFRKSIIREPDPGPTYAELMGENDFGSALSGPSKGAQTQPNTPTKKGVEKIEPEDVLKTVQAAYEYFDTFKALIVDLNLSFKELNFSRESFDKLKGEEALNVLQVELNFMYESLFTKAIVLHSRWGWTFRLLSFISVVAAFIIFGFYERTHHISDGVDIRVTYTLLWGAIGLDLMSFLNAISSDWIVALAKKKKGYETRMKKFMVEVCNSLAPLLKFIVFLKQPKWASCETNFQPKSFDVLATSPFFRRWSGSIFCHSLISYCLQGRSKRIFKFSCPVSKMLHQANDFLCDKIFSTIHWLQIDNLCLPISDFVEEIRYVTEEPFPKKLWEFIFNELKKKSLSADTAESANRIFSARGDWVLERDGKDFDCDGLMPYILDLEYDESLLLWHIATEILHNTVDIAEQAVEQAADEQAEDRIFSKMLSDYMFYLLTFQSRMMAEVAGMDKLTFQDTCAHAKTFFAGKKLQPHQEKKACQKIRYASLQHIAGGGLSSKSVLFKAGKLADELEIMGEDKWKILSRVWVELLSYAATHCRPYTQVQLLAKGGGLLSIVWLLMAHLGIGRLFKYK